jgi:hypothetical protein
VQSVAVFLLLSFGVVVAVMAGERAYRHSRDVGSLLHGAMWIGLGKLKRERCGLLPILVTTGLQRRSPASLPQPQCAGGTTRFRVARD